ncbi:penicillin-binding protein 2 [Candidatus Uhrbacteria bacterium]|nr:penicillin-binding protein 2 [Candidatus Uhrbacteria bacterium]
MDPFSKQESPFRLTQVGTGQRIDKRKSDLMSHEVLFEDDFAHVQERPLFLGVTFSRSRFIIALFLIVLLVFSLLGRAYWMQIVKHNDYQVQAENNRLRHVPIAAQRGIIEDRNGTVLAENVPSFDVQITPQFLPSNPNERTALLANVGRAISMSLDDIQSILERASSTDPFESLTLKRDIPYVNAVSFRLLEDHAAIRLVIGQKRHYPYAASVPSLSHVLGYVGAISALELERVRDQGYIQTDLFGKTGVEYSYEKRLRGVFGEDLYEVDALNRPTHLVSQKKPIDGAEVRLSLDFGLQQVAEKALREEMEKNKLQRGSVVALDPRDGSILAIVSWPAYDNNAFSGSVSSTYYASLLANQERPLLPRAWAGVFPSGSTIKPVVAAAALSEGVITKQTSIDSTGGIRVGSTFFPDWKAGGHGATNVRRALAWSVNTFFYYVGGGFQSFTGLGIDRLTSWMRRFGLGARTGIDVPGEVTGFVPSAEWKARVKGERWYIGDTYNLSIGQGDLLVTPLQVAVYTAEVANGGHVIVPHIGQDVVSTPTTTPIIDPAIDRVIQDGMRDTVVYGSGRALAGIGFEVSGKTGTAQWRTDKANHAWFTAFAPTAKPEIALAVLLEEGEEGSKTAIPVAKSILEYWYKHKK